MRKQIKKRSFRVVASALALIMGFQMMMDAGTMQVSAEDGIQVSEAAFTPAMGAVVLDAIPDGSTGYLVGENLSAYPGEGDSIAVSEASGEKCWTIGGDTGNQYLYLNVDDLYLQEKDLTMIATVKYLDQGTGSFLIEYDQHSQDQTANKYVKSQPVELTNSGQWKTAEIELSHAYLFNRQARNGAPGKDTPYKRNADLRIAAVSELCVASVEVREAVEVTGLNQENPGNIFTTEEDIFIPLQVYNAMGKDTELTVEYAIETSRGEQVGEAVSFASNVKNGKAIETPVKPEVTAKGVYFLQVTIKDGEKELVKETIRFSLIAPNSPDRESDPYFGVQTHLVKTIFETTPEPVDNIMSLIEKAGVQAIRDEMYWGMAEPEKDEFEFKPQWEQYIGHCEEMGIEPLLILSYGNNLYKDPDEGGTPTPGTTEQIAAFAEYARQMATHYKGRIKKYEVWNEWNGGMNNRPEGGAAAGIKYFADTYTALMKATYTAIKSVDPDATVVGCVSGGANTFYIESVCAAGGFDYMDEVSYHPYNYPSVPDRMSGNVGTYEGLRSISAILKRYGGEKPLVISEQGFPVLKDNYAASVGVSEQAQASYLMRMFAMGKAYGAKQIYIYDFQDDGTYGAREQNFGVIDFWRGDEVPYAAKESYVALNNITNQLKGAEFVQEYSINRYLKAYQFTRPDGKDVVMLWNVYTGSKVEYKGKTANMQAFDLFGNPCDMTYVGEDPIYLVGDSGSFDIDNVVAQRWYAPSASASHGIKDSTKDQGTYYYDSYISSAPWLEGITMWTQGGVGVPEFIVRGERKGWVLKNDPADDKEDNQIVADIDDSVMREGCYEVKISVDYFDEGEGAFYVYYDGPDGKKLAGKVDLTGDNAWKTAEFLVKDAFFGNRLEDGDLIISLQDEQNVFGTDSLVVASVTAERRTAYVDLSDTSPAANGLAAKMATGSPNLVEVQGQKGWRLNNAQQHAYFDVDESYIYGGETKVEIEVTYFDSSEIGKYNNGNTSKGFFRVGYDKKAGAGNDFKFLPAVEYEGTDTWKTATFTVDSAVFEATAATKGAMDLTVSAFVPSKPAGERISPVPVVVGKVTVRRIAPASASVKLGKEVESRYLEVMPSGNTCFYTTPAYNGVSTMQTNKALSSPNIFLLVNDRFMFNTDCTAVLELTYWDEGAGNITLQYDAVGNKNQALTIPYTNTGDFRTVQIDLPNACFANRRAQKSDILISRSNGNIALASAKLTVKDPENNISKGTETGPVEMDTTPPGPVVDLRAQSLDGAAFLRWTNPEDGFATNATMGELRVYMQEDGAYKLINYKMDSPANNVEGKYGFYYVNGLENGKEYTFMVTATDKWLNESEGVTVKVTPQADSFTVSNMWLESVTGEFLDQPGDSTEFYVRATAQNTTASPRYVTMMVAEYDENNRMVALHTQPRLVMNETKMLPEPNSKDTVEIGIKVSLSAPLAETHTLKAFVWNDLDNQVPYVNAFSVQK